MFYRKIITIVFALSLLFGLTMQVLATAASDAINALENLTNTAVEAKIIESAENTGLSSYQILGKIISLARP